MRGHLIDVNQRPLREWRQTIAQLADEQGLRPREGAVGLTLDFYFGRPQGHFGKRGLRPSAPSRPQVRPDLDKLARAVLDALTGVAYRDDAQVCDLVVRKHYADEGPPGLVIEVAYP